MISSGMSEEATRDALEQVRGGEARIVYCSPERFGSRVFLEALGRRRIDLLAVDEAHCVSEWGHDFRPDYLRLPQIADRLGRPTVMACTATATETVADEIATRFGMLDPLIVRSGFDRPNLSFDVVRLEGKGSKARRTALLEAGPGRPREPPRDRLLRDPQGHRRGGPRTCAAPPASAPRPTTRAWTQRSATATQERFMAGEVETIVATNAFGMGVDKADVRSVWHMAIPTSVEAYYQEAGRAGRDGLPAKAVLLAMRSDLGRLVRFNEQRSPEQEIARERGWQRLPGDQILHLLRPLPATPAPRPFQRQHRGSAARTLLRRLRPRALAPRPGDDGVKRRSARRAAPPPRPSSPTPTRRSSTRSGPGGWRRPPASPPTPSPTTSTLGDDRRGQARRPGGLDRDQRRRAGASSSKSRRRRDRRSRSSPRTASPSLS